MSNLSWQEKWARYRRYGLEPLPTDASDEMREARLQELRRLRLRRRRRYVLGSGLGTLALVALGLVLVWWLVSTLAGRNLLLAQIKARLPANTQFEWTDAEGPLRGPMTLHGVKFSWTACADDDFDVNTTAMALCKDKRISHFHASRLMLQPRLGALIGRRLQLQALEVEGAALSLASTDTPFELPTWPEVLPRIEPPLAIEVDAVRVRGLKVTSDGEPVIDIHRLDGAALADSGHLSLQKVAVDSDRGLFHVHGSYAPARNYATDLTATAVLPAPAGQTRGRLGLIARGHLADMNIFVGGRAPAPLRAHLNLRADNPDAAEAGNTRWQFHGQSEGLDVAVLTGAGRSSALPMAFNLAAQGQGGDARLQGEWSQGETAIKLKSSRLRLEAQTLHAAPLALEVLGGELVLRGHGSFKAEAAEFKLAANARGLGWSDAQGNARIKADADLGIAGTREAWAIIGKAGLVRDKQKADVRLDGRGDGNGLSLKALQVTMPEGRLDANGRVDWAPALQWQLDAVLAGFNPGYFLPDFPGAVRGKLASRGQMQAQGGLDADFNLAELGGQLRGRTLSGQGQAQIRGETYAGELSLGLGQSRINAKGRYGQRVDAEASFTPLQLADLLPGAQGILQGRVKVSGPANAPDVEADLQGRGLAHQDYRAQQLRLQGWLPWQQGSGNLRLEAQGLALGTALESLQLTARGSVQNLQLQAQASAEIGRLQLAASTRQQGGLWRGELASLDFNPVRGAAWRLQAPLQYVQTSNGFNLSQGCFTSAAGGSLCAGGQWPGRGIEVQGRALPLLLATPYLPERDDGKPWVLDGNIDLDANIKAQGGAWAGQAQVRSISGSLATGPRADDELVRYRNLLLDAQFNSQRLQATLESGISQDGRIKARVETGWDEFAPLSGQMNVDMRDLGWLEAFARDIVDPVGQLSGQLSLAGTRGNPLLGGNAELTGFRAEVPAYGLVLSEGRASLQAQPDGNARISGRVRSGEGFLDVQGTLGWQGQDVPIVLNVRGNNVLLSDTRDLRAVVNPDVTVKIQGNAPLDVSGAVSIPSAQMDLERLDAGVSTSADVVILDPANPARTPGSGMNLDINLVIGDEVYMRGFGLDGQLGGSMRVRARPGSEMRASGGLTVEGKYAAYGQKLDIERGRLNWNNDPVADPILDLRARRVVGDVSAGIHVSGRVSAMQATVWSDPQMDQSEALAYLTLGRSLSTASGEEGRQINAASAALSAGSTLLASQIATRIGFDDAGVIQSNTLGGSVFGVGKYLSPRVYVGYGVSLLGTGQVLTLKYLLRRGFDITIETSTVENKGSVNWRHEK